MRRTPYPFRLARGRRCRIALAVAAVLAGVALGAPPAAATGSLTGVIWSATSSVTGTTGVSYTFAFRTATTSSLSSVTMPVPAGTGGSPTVSSVSPASIAGGTVALASNTLTYSFTAVSVAANLTISIKLGGITNTSTAGSSTSTVTTRNGASAVDTGTSGTVTFTANALTSPTWSVSSSVVGASGVSYTYGFSNTLSAFTTLTMTVPPGTGGTPVKGPVSGITLGTVSLSGTTLTLNVLSVQIGAVSIEIDGLTNTSTAGSYVSEIAGTVPLLGTTISGFTPAVSFTGGLTMTSPASLGWSAGLTGSGQSIVDGTSGDQQLSVDDESGAGVGWHITVSATTFTTGLTSLPSTGTFVFTGSLTSATAPTAPTVTCASSCTLPSTTTTYPVMITTAASSPTPATIFSTPAATGIGPVTIGGHSAAAPVGWWINVPANAIAGSYTSTITLAVVSGP